MTSSATHRPGLRVWKWERDLLGVFIGALAVFAAAVLTVAFTLKGSGKVIAFIVALILIVIVLGLCVAAANGQPIRPGSRRHNYQAKERKPSPGLVNDPSKTFAKDPDTVGQPPIPPPGEPE